MTTSIISVQHHTER